MAYTCTFQISRVLGQLTCLGLEKAEDGEWKALRGSAGKKNKRDITERHPWARGLGRPNRKGWVTPAFTLQTPTEGPAQNCLDT